VAYRGNNAEDVSDFEAPSIATVGSFGTTGLAAGNVLSFDVTPIFNTAVTSGWSSLGVRLQAAPGTVPNGGAWTFDASRLTVDDQGRSVTPEPATYALLGSGLALLVSWRARQRPRIFATRPLR